MEIKLSEQQQLLSRSRAVSERMSSEVNPVQERGLGVGCPKGYTFGYRVSENSNHYTLPPNTYTLFPNPVALDATNLAYLSQIEASKEEKVINCHQEVKPALMANNVEATSTDNSFFPAAMDIEAKEINSVVSSQTSGAKGQVNYSSQPQDIPRDEKGCAENPDAYRLWQPEKLEGEQVNPNQLRERLASLSQRFAMPKPVQQFESKNQIEELNEWLKEPILRNEVMARVIRSNNLTVEFDEEGIPIRVINQSD